jgi:ornithine cyclodeaminase
MADYPDVLFLSYQDTLELLGVDDALLICEKVYRMHAARTVVWTTPPALQLSVGQPYHTHWQVKGVLLKEIPVSGVRLFNYYDDGAFTNVGRLDRLGYVQLSDPNTSHALAIVDEHWTYAIRSAAAAVVGCKWLGPSSARTVALLGVGTMATNALRCLLQYYRFSDVRCTSRRLESRTAKADEWSNEFGINVHACDSAEQAVRDADIVIGGTSSTDIICREGWLKPGSTFISLSPRQLDPADWSRMDKVIVDSWEWCCLNPIFQTMLDAGQFTKEQLYAEIHEVVSGRKPGRTSATERILVHTAGLVSQDVAIAHQLFLKAKEANVGIWLPAARTRPARMP